MRLKVNRYAVAADAAPDDPALTPYDIEHMITYLRLLDADAEGADWREVAQIVLRIDPETEPARAKRLSREPFGPCSMDDAHGLPTSVARRYSQPQLRLDYGRRRGLAREIDL
jgi:hypothetical protein